MKECVFLFPSGIPDQDCFHPLANQPSSSLKAKPETYLNLYLWDLALVRLNGE